VLQVDGNIGATLGEAGPRAKSAQGAGYTGVWTGETSHDPFLRLLLASEATTDLEIGTSVAIAFARSPLTMATLGRDLNDRSAGRLNLGIGSQVKAHIERRFSMPWSRPAARMREYIAAMRAIWKSWQDGTPLDFRGDFYTHTLMPPMFAQGPSDHGVPRLFLAAVGPEMTRVAAGSADGLLVHPFSTPAYIAEITTPLLEAGRADSTFQVSAPVFVATGTTEEEVQVAALAARKQLAFYASTPSYRAVLDHHGWGDLQTELTVLSKTGRWDDMAEAIDDGLLRTFAVVGEPSTIGAEVVRRYDGLVDRVNLYLPHAPAQDVVDQIARDISTVE